jgi:hypothetical protein
MASSENLFTQMCLVCKYYRYVPNTQRPHQCPWELGLMSNGNCPKIMR